MKIINSEKGITLAVLIITVVILAILTGVSLNVYSNYSNSIRLEKFNTELDTIQLRVNEIANIDENYIDQSGNIVYLKNLGETVTTEQLNTINTILSNINITDATVLAEDFKFFSKENLEKQLNVSAIEQDVFINFDKKIVLSASGIKIGDTMHYISTNQKYTVDGSNAQEDDIEIKYDYISDGLYTVSITSKTNYYAMRYRLQGEEYWNAVIDKSFKGEENKTYEILFTKIDGSTIIKEITLPEQNQNVLNTINETI